MIHPLIIADHLEYQNLRAELSALGVPQSEHAEWLRLGATAITYGLTLQDVNLLLVKAARGKHGGRK
jgi:hypothetical protein